MAVVATAQEKVLWRDPCAVQRINFAYPAGGRANVPQPPFIFVSEEGGGTNPKVLVRDHRGVVWRMKGGQEVLAESFATRFAAALGYHAEPTAFIAQGV
ncbi:MAG TPA: hypothetical protein VFL80_05675, partial [Thermoanaerobaculia bacterium]|nr:hypothetical protein [Thermoanaerobaculia bacterium]